MKRVSSQASRVMEVPHVSLDLGASCVAVCVLWFYLVKCVERALWRCRCSWWIGRLSLSSVTSDVCSIGCATRGMAQAGQAASLSANAIMFVLVELSFLCLSGDLTNLRAIEAVLVAGLYRLTEVGIRHYRF